MSAFTVGLDLGQTRDFSALVVVERVRALPPGVSLAAWSRAVDAVDEARNIGHLERVQSLASRVPATVEQFHVRHLQRWEVGTPYPAVVADVADLMRADPLREHGTLFLDGTGVGVAVTDLFRAAYREGTLRGAYPPIAVTITGGEHGQGWNVPKVDLIGAVQAPLQSGRLKIAAGLALGGVLERELVNFRMKLTAAGRQTYEAPRREGEGHGDLVMALALALVHPHTGRPQVIETPAAMPAGPGAA